MRTLQKILTLFIGIGAVAWWVWGFNALSNIYFVLGLAEAVTVAT